MRNFRVHPDLSKCSRGTWSEKGWESMVYITSDNWLYIKAISDEIINGFVQTNTQETLISIVRGGIRDTYNGMSNPMDSNPWVFESKNQGFFEYVDSK